METTLSGVQAASLFVGVALPILVGLVTHDKMPAAVRPVLLLLLSSVSAVLTEYINADDIGSDDFSWEASCLTALTTFVTAVAVHYGFWKSIGVADALKLALVRPKGTVPISQRDTEDPTL